MMFILEVAAGMLTVLCGVLYFFYAYTIKAVVDNHLTMVFRKASYEADAAAGRTVYKSLDTPGFHGMMKEATALFEGRKGKEQSGQHFYEVFASGMDVFFAKLGVPPDDYAAFCKAYPRLATWMNKTSANVTFSWVVGGARIEHVEGNVMGVKKCHFREQIGEEGCIQMCKQPVEKYFTERMHAPITIAPQPREQGLGCKFCYGGCLPEKLQW